LIGKILIARFVAKSCHVLRSPLLLPTRCRILAGRIQTCLFQVLFIGIPIGFFFLLPTVVLPTAVTVREAVLLVGLVSRS
jgi:hypothetical protein